MARVGTDTLTLSVEHRAGALAAFPRFPANGRRPTISFDEPAEYDYTPGYYAVFFADPDGIKLELVHEPRFDQPAD